MLTEAKLDFWIKNNLNVLIRGKKGTAKSTMVIDAFKRNKLSWMYFSAATMDPWVDFIGVPKEVKDTNGNSYLELIKPKAFSEDKVEAIFFDEFNRSKPKIRNAVMELIQFKSINGKPFKNLKMIWAAINPDNKDDENEEDYDVEVLDPAQLDRFHIIVNSDNNPNNKYFKDKFSDNGEIGVEWWHSLDKKFKDMISPRRLDYALEIHKMGGDLNDVFPKEINVSQLASQLSNGSFIKKLKNLYNEKNESEIAKSLNNENFFDGVKTYILKNKEYLEYFCQYFPSEKFNSLFISEFSLREHILNNNENINKFNNRLQEILDAKVASKKLLKEIKQAIDVVAVGNTTLSCIVMQYMKPRGDTMPTTQDRNRVIDMLLNIDLTKETEVAVIKALALACIIVGRTQSTFSKNTKTVFGNIEEYASLIGKTFADMYLLASAEDFFKTKPEKVKQKIYDRLVAAQYKLY